ncbi:MULTISPECIES: transposase [Nocardioides]|uniref:Transposase n=1 Tax=Nocardioides taihuensis TaxID=1835606 RepID=A0ABW0BR22_9ACTN|nr:transposase [Nocardioides sp.]HQR28368.1 hypothetical protein [Nocardioides sp.]
MSHTRCAWVGSACGSRLGRWSRRPSRVVIDTHLARGASNGGLTFHERGGPYGRTKGAKRFVAVEVTSLPVAALVVPASTHENRTSDLMLEHLDRQGVTDRLELVLVDRGVTAAAARTLGRDHRVEVRRVGWDDRQSPSDPSGTPGASRLRTVPLPSEVVREHHHLGHRMASGRWKTRDPVPSRPKSPCASSMLVA